MSTNNGTVLKAALIYRGAGLSIVPISRDGSKLPASRLLPEEIDEASGEINRVWKPFQSRIATEQEVRGWCDRPKPPGIAIVGGRVSGNLEHLDFDEDAATIFPQWCDLVESECPGLVDRLSTRDTPKDGYHVSYRCTEVTIPGNTKLAEKPHPDDPKKTLTLIETRGEGGYAVAPGSPVECHEAKRPYKHHRGPKLSEVQTITAAEREALWRAAQSFDLMPSVDRFSSEAGTKAPDSRRPGDDFNRRGPDWLEFMPGWDVAHERGKVRYLRRPGKDSRGWSATVGYCTSKEGIELLAVFSTNAAPLEGANGRSPCTPYSKFAAYTFLNHEGDFKAAAKALASQGYGERRGAGANDERGVEDEPWDPPVPLTNSVTLPAFPVEVLPAWLSSWVTAEAEALQVPVDLPGMLTLGVAGAAIAGRYRVRARPGWSEPVNLFVVCCLPPGERKSTAFAHATAPVEEYEAELRREESPRIAEKESEHRQLEARLKHIENKIAKEDNGFELAKLKETARNLARDLASHAVPDMPQLICDDVTVEKLANLLARQGGRILQASAEGTAFEIAKGRYSEGANFDVYLRGHAGDPLRTGRMGRDSELVEQPALSCALAVQPDVIHGLAENATMRGRGFLARWLYSMPVSQVGRRKIDAAPVPMQVAQTYMTNMMAMWGLKGAVSQEGKPEPNWLTFSPGAHEVLRDFEAWLEPQLAEGGGLSGLAGWGNKLAGAAVRIAEVLHMAATIGSSMSWPPVISPDTAEQAITLARGYLLPHAQAAFNQMGADRRLVEAARVVHWLPKGISVNSVSIVSRGPTYTVSVRDVHRNVFSGRTRVEQVEEVIGLLVKLGYLRPHEDGQQKHGSGRKPSQRFEVNPAVLEAV
jgi:hypothetical protein